MTPEIERLAKEAGLHFIGETGFGPISNVWHSRPQDLVKFAALIAEECAKECEALSFTKGGPVGMAKLQRVLCADAIRAKFALRHKEN